MKNKAKGESMKRATVGVSIEGGNMVYIAVTAENYYELGCHCIEAATSAYRNCLNYERLLKEEFTREELLEIKAALDKVGEDSETYDKVERMLGDV